MACFVGEQNANGLWIDRNRLRFLRKPQYYSGLSSFYWTRQNVTWV